MATVLNTANTQANISGNIFPNGNNLVTAAMVASVLQNISVSYINRITDYNLLGLKVFSTTTQYQIGDCAVYSGQLYQCTTAHLGAWSSGDFSLVGGGGTGTVTSFVFTNGGGFTGTVTNAGTTPTLSLVLQNASASQSGQLTSTDWSTFNGKQASYAILTTLGGLANASGVLTNNGSGTLSWAAASTGTVTSASVVSANGFAGTVATATTTPAITLTTTITGLLKGNGTAISAATSGTDYAPATSGGAILYGNGAGGFSNVTIGSGLTFSGGTLSTSAASVAISALIAATATNSIDNANYGQTWAWNSLGGSNIGLSLTSSSGASNGGTIIFNVAQTGTISNANQTVLAAKIYNTATNTQINVGLQVEATGGAAGNAAIYVPTSGIGIGTNQVGYGFTNDNKLHLQGSGSTSSTRTTQIIQNTNNSGAAQLLLYNAGLKYLQIQTSGSSWAGGEKAYIGTTAPSGNYNLVLGADASSGSSLFLSTNSVSRFQADGSGNISMVNAYIGAVGTSATAYLHLAASTTSKASLRIVSGTAPTSPNDGDIWYTGTSFLQRVGSTTKTIWVGNDAATAPSTTVGVTISSYYGSSATNFLGTPNSWASVVVNGTTYKIPLYT